MIGQCYTPYRQPKTINYVYLCLMENNRYRVWQTLTLLSVTHRGVPLDRQRVSGCHSSTAKSWLSDGWICCLHVMGMVLKLSRQRFSPLKSRVLHLPSASPNLSPCCLRLCTLIQMASQPIRSDIE